MAWEISPPLARGAGGGRVIWFLKAAIATAIDPTFSIVLSNEQMPRPVAILKLVTLWSLISLVWLAALPALSRRPAIEARLNELSAEGIDPSAMFYSELEAMEGVLLRLDRFHRRQPGALWGLQSANHHRDPSELARRNK